jgi:hypothetical protein
MPTKRRTERNEPAPVITKAELAEWYETLGGEAVWLAYRLVKKGWKPRRIVPFVVEVARIMHHARREAR